MIEEVAANIYRIGVPLPGNPLREVNSYFIRGDGGDLLIDTGFRREECYRALRFGLDELGAEQDRLDVLATHMHSDHLSQSIDFAGDRRRIYLSRRDLAYLRRILKGESQHIMRLRFVAEGFPEDVVDRIQKNNPARIYGISRMDDRFTDLDEANALGVGQYSLTVVPVPGHTPGNTMLWLESQKIMFTGDHILFDISPNITAFADVEDSLGDYIESLNRVKGFHVELALPGHRNSGDYHARIDALIAHHERRIAQAERIISETPGLSAYEIASRMTWKIRAKDWDDFPEIQKWYAVGECISHLDYLRKRNRIERERHIGVWKYHT
jgi:glyoxylase-like metal-dependent hydrolase (beta-lactamase superfamily II)